MQLKLLSKSIVVTGETVDVRLRLLPQRHCVRGARVWLFWDIRQEAGWLQTADGDGRNFVSVQAGGAALRAEVHSIRTLDLHPELPEFMGMVEVERIAGGLTAGEVIDVSVSNWQAPHRPIKEFHFWALVDEGARWDFVGTEYKSYRKFVERSNGDRVHHDELMTHTASAAIEIAGEYPSSVELLKNGRGHRAWPAKEDRFDVELEEEPSCEEGVEFYLVRVRQRDGHSAWSSPIWLV